MTEKTYPYVAWTLLPSFKPKQVTLTHGYDRFQHAGIWDVAESGKLYSVAKELFPTKEAAIAAGWERVHEQEAKVAKMLDGINKKRAALAKAEESL